jgi:tRNA-dihydrouridine synthase
MPCPVLANGNVYSASNAESVLRSTGARGLMIGRGAIRNPWLFDQIRAWRRGEPPRLPRGRDVLDYVRRLYHAVCSPEARELSQVQKMKRYMNFLGLGVDAPGPFLHDIRRVATKAAFFDVCERHLNHDRPMALQPLTDTGTDRTA